MVETLGVRVGFREVEVRGQALLVNGRAVKLNAVNSHVHHPDTGRAMDVATMREDLVLMKRFGVNAVRTSHYPPNVEYLDLADELGVYVIDEAGTEAHATEFLSERPEWREAYVERGRKMVLRDRNHPSIILWSAGNESGSGDNICAVIAEGKRLDPSRPAWMYGGNNDYFPENDPLDCEDVVGPRYPIPFELETRIARVPESVDPRPSFMDEYAAATGNSLGGLDEYWDVIRAHPRTIGGAVWDWVSPGIRATWRETPDGSPHGNHGALMGRAALAPGRSGQARGAERPRRVGRGLPRPEPRHHRGPADARGVGLPAAVERDGDLPDQGQPPVRPSADGGEDARVLRPRRASGPPSSPRRRTAGRGRGTTSPVSTTGRSSGSSSTGAWSEGRPTRARSRTRPSP